MTNSSLWLPLLITLVSLATTLAVFWAWSKRAAPSKRTRGTRIVTDAEGNNVRRSTRCVARPAHVLKTTGLREHFRRHLGFDKSRGRSGRKEGASCLPWIVAGPTHSPTPASLTCVQVAEICHEMESRRPSEPHRHEQQTGAEPQPGPGVSPQHTKQPRLLVPPCVRTCYSAALWLYLRARSLPGNVIF